jgi:hypothetical protein
MEAGLLDARAAARARDPVPGARPAILPVVCLGTSLPLDEASISELWFSRDAVEIGSEVVPYADLEATAIDEFAVRWRSASVAGDLGLEGHAFGPFPRDALAPLGTGRRRAGVLWLAWRGGGYLLAAADASWTELSTFVFSTPLRVPGG